MLRPKTLDPVHLQGGELLLAPRPPGRGNSRLDGFSTAASLVSRTPKGLLGGQALRSPGLERVQSVREDRTHVFDGKSESTGRTVQVRCGAELGDLPLQLGQHDANL